MFLVSVSSRAQVISSTHKDACLGLQTRKHDFNVFIGSNSSLLLASGFENFLKGKKRLVNLH